MLYMVEQTLKPGHPDTHWHQWVNGMKPPERFMSVPGFRSAQRFKGITNPLAYCAIYSVACAEVMTSAAYKGIGGGVHTGKQWTEHIAYWERDLLDGVAIAPAVPEGYVLLVKKTSTLDFADDGLPYMHLTVAGLNNKAAPYCGIAVVPEGEARRSNLKGVRDYRPITAQLLDVASSYCL